MIVFNYAAIAVAVIIAIVVAPVIFIGNWISPGAMDGNWAIAACALIGTLISAACDAAGLKGRLFWLPMWLWGLGIAGYALYEEVGWVGPVGALVAAGLLFGALMYWVYADEKKSWANAPAALEAARASVQLGQHQQAWEQLEKALFVPSMLTATGEMWRQLREVLALIYNLTGGQVDPELSQQLAELDQQLASGGEPSEIEVDDAIIEALRELIEQRLGNRADDGEAAPRPA